MAVLCRADFHRDAVIDFRGNHIDVRDDGQCALLPQRHGWTEGWDSENAAKMVIQEEPRW